MGESGWRMERRIVGRGCSPQPRRTPGRFAARRRCASDVGHGPPISGQVTSCVDAMDHVRTAARVDAEQVDVHGHVDRLPGLRRGIDLQPGRVVEGHRDDDQLVTVLLVEEPEDRRGPRVGQGDGVAVDPEAGRGLVPALAFLEGVGFGGGHGCGNAAPTPPRREGRPTDSPGAPMPKCARDQLALPGMMRRKPSKTLPLVLGSVPVNCPSSWTRAPAR